jgi:hypothetical protein
VAFLQLYIKTEDAANPIELSQNQALSARFVGAACGKARKPTRDTPATKKQRCQMRSQSLK